MAEERAGTPGDRYRSPAERERLDALKRQIDAGQYETEEMLEKTLHRMLADLRGAATKAATTSREDGSGGESP